MTSFEQFLMEMGYEKFIYDCKEGYYKRAVGHTLSSLSNLDHRYFHKTDLDIERILKPDFAKIPLGELRSELVKGEIIFGLHEKDMPPTLQYPLPFFEVIRPDSDRKYLVWPPRDADVQAMLDNIPHNLILLAMYNKTIKITVDLTK